MESQLWAVAGSVFALFAASAIIRWLDAWARAIPEDQVTLGAEIKALKLEAEAINTPRTFVAHTRLTRVIVGKENRLDECKYRTPLFHSFLLSFLPVCVFEAGSAD